MPKFAARRHGPSAAFLSALALIVAPIVAPSGAASSFQLPSSIAHDCSVDVTQPILSFIASVPDNSVVSFGAGACYRIEGTLELDNRSGLDLEGNGATFRSLNAPADQRALWRIVDSTSISLHNMTIDGSYAHGGTFDASLEHAHAIDLRGSSVEIGGATMTDVAGDCVYFGRGYTTALTRSSGSLHDSTCLRTGRNAVSVTAGDHILVQRLTTGTIGYDVFDVEPNLGPDWGSNDVTFEGNTIGLYAMNAYSVVESGPISNQSFTNNRLTGVGLKIAVADPLGGGYRPQNVTISGNSSDTTQKPAAINVDNADGLTITSNYVPVAGGPMAAVSGSCNVQVFGSTYPGGSIEAVIFPSVCSLSPSSGAPGTAVTLTGAGLDGASAMTLNGTPATFSVDSSTQITFTVPAGATSGPVIVTTPNGTATAPVGFAVTGSASPLPAPALVLAAPQITGFTPSSGPAGTTVTLSGSAFEGTTVVTVGGVAASFQTNSGTQITLTVPAGAATGLVGVTTPAGSAQSASAFTITTTSRKGNGSGSKNRH